MSSAVLATKRNHLLMMNRNRSGSQGASEVNLALIGELGSGKSGNVYISIINIYYNIGARVYTERDSE